METLHTKNIIHRDIKPENFVIGLGKTGKNLHLIDFGLAKYFRSKSGKHIPLIDGKGLVGTARYCSVNTHKGIEQSRRDDLESLIQSLIFIGSPHKLPWCVKKGIQAVTIKKQTIDEAELCFGLPKEFTSLLIYVKSLRFSKRPNYDYMR